MIFIYLDESIYPRYDYRSRRYDSSKRLRTIVPDNCEIEITESFDDTEYNFKIKHYFVSTNGDLRTIYQQTTDGCGGEDIILKKLVISNEDKEILMKLIDRAKEYVLDKRQAIRKSNNDTVLYFILKKEYWAMLSKVPKRPIETLYLKGTKRIINRFGR